MGFLDELKRLTHPTRTRWKTITMRTKTYTKTRTNPRSATRPRPPGTEEPRRREYQEPPRRNNGGKVVNIHATTQLQVVLVKPDRFENAAEIADHLREKRTVVLNLESTNKDIARRLLDFLSGVAYANEAKSKRWPSLLILLRPTTWIF